MRKYLTPNGLVERPAYVNYLRQCAQRWRCAPSSTDKDRAENEEQAKRVEAKAEQISKGEE